MSLEISQRSKCVERLEHKKQGQHRPHSTGSRAVGRVGRVGRSPSGRVSGCCTFHGHVSAKIAPVAVTQNLTDLEKSARDFDRRREGIKNLQSQIVRKTGNHISEIEIAVPMMPAFVVGLDGQSDYDWSP